MIETCSNRSHSRVSAAMCSTVCSITRSLHAKFSIKCFQHSFRLLLVQTTRIRWKHWNITYINSFWNCLRGKVFGPNSFLSMSSLLLRLFKPCFNWIFLQFLPPPLTSLLLRLLVILCLLCSVLIRHLFFIKSQFVLPISSLILKKCSCKLTKNNSYRTAAPIEPFFTDRWISLHFSNECS